MRTFIEGYDYHAATTTNCAPTAELINEKKKQQKNKVQVSTQLKNTKMPRRKPGAFVLPAFLRPPETSLISGAPPPQSSRRFSVNQGVLP